MVFLQTDFIYKMLSLHLQIFFNGGGKCSHLPQNFFIGDSHYLPNFFTQGGWCLQTFFFNLLSSNHLPDFEVGVEWHELCKDGRT